METEAYSKTQLPQGTKPSDTYDKNPDKDDCRDRFEDVLQMIEKKAVKKQKKSEKFI